MEQDGNTTQQMNQPSGYDESKNGFSFGGISAKTTPVNFSAKTAPIEAAMGVLPCDYNTSSAQSQADYILNLKRKQTYNNLRNRNSVFNSSTRFGMGLSPGYHSNSFSELSNSMVGNNNNIPRFGRSFAFGQNNQNSFMTSTFNYSDKNMGMDESMESTPNDQQQGFKNSSNMLNGTVSVPRIGQNILQNSQETPGMGVFGQSSFNNSFNTPNSFTNNINSETQVCNNFKNQFPTQHVAGNLYGTEGVGVSKQPLGMFTGGSSNQRSSLGQEGIFSGSFNNSEASGLFGSNKSNKRDKIGINFQNQEQQSTLENLQNTNTLQFGSRMINQQQRSNIFGKSALAQPGMNQFSSEVDARQSSILNQPLNINQAKTQPQEGFLFGNNFRGFHNNESQDHKAVTQPQNSSLMTPTSIQPQNSSLLSPSSTSQQFSSGPHNQLHNTLTQEVTNIKPQSHETPQFVGVRPPENNQTLSHNFGSGSNQFGNVALSCQNTAQNAFRQGVQFPGKQQVRLEQGKDVLEDSNKQPSSYGTCEQRSNIRPEDQNKTGTQTQNSLFDSSKVLEQTSTELEPKTTDTNNSTIMTKSAPSAESKDTYSLHTPAQNSTSGISQNSTNTQPTTPLNQTRDTINNTKREDGIFSGTQNVLNNNVNTSRQVFLFNQKDNTHGVLPTNETSPGNTSHRLISYPSTSIFRNAANSNIKKGINEQEQRPIFPKYIASEIKTDTSKGIKLDDGDGENLQKDLTNDRFIVDTPLKSTSDINNSEPQDKSANIEEQKQSEFGKLLPEYSLPEPNTLKLLTSDKEKLQLNSLPSSITPIKNLGLLSSNASKVSTSISLGTDATNGESAVSMNLFLNADHHNDVTVDIKPLDNRNLSIKEPIFKTPLPKTSDGSNVVVKSTLGKRKNMFDDHKINSSKHMVTELQDGHEDKEPFDRVVPSSESDYQTKEGEKHIEANIASNNDNSPDKSKSEHESTTDREEVPKTSNSSLFTPLPEILEGTTSPIDNDSKEVPESISKSNNESNVPKTSSSTNHIKTPLKPANNIPINDFLKSRETSGRLNGYSSGSISNKKRARETFEDDNLGAKGDQDDENYQEHQNLKRDTLETPKKTKAEHNQSMSQFTAEAFLTFAPECFNADTIKKCSKDLRKEICEVMLKMAILNKSIVKLVADYDSECSIPDYSRSFIDYTSKMLCLKDKLSKLFSKANPEMVNRVGNSLWLKKSRVINDQ